MRRSRRSTPWSRVGVASVALLLLALAAPAMGQIGTENGEWRYWGGDVYSTRYSPLDQINAENFENLEVAWRWKTANYGPKPENIFRATPIYVKGKLYTVAGSRRAVVCIDPETGETLWMWRIKENPRWAASSRKNYGKGVAWANVDGRDYIYVITTGLYLVALDADSGLPIPSFGINGVVDLALGLGDYPVHPDRGVLDSGDITSSSPPIVVNGVIIANVSHKQGYYPERKENIPGHIRGYDAKTGKMLWIFHVVPQPGELGHDTWEKDSWKYTGNISTWTPISADPELGIVYCDTDTPTNDYYGGDRPGDNLYGTSMIALDVKTGKRVWHFQQVHHDVWNYDNPTAPLLLNVTVDGKRTPIVTEATKQGFLYVWNRKTGEPVWPIEERPVPHESEVPKEKLSPTQPFPTKPAPFEHQGITDDDLIDFTPELKQEAMKIAHQYKMGPLFNPPSLAHSPDGTKGSFFVPGAMGGANIPGGPAADPETGIIYIATYRGYGILGLVPGAERRGGPSTCSYVSLGGRGVRVQGLNILKPPWGSIVAIDLNTGEHLWRIPNGDTPENVKNHPALKGADLPVTGHQSHATILVTKTLMIYGEGRSGEPLLHAVDKRTGQEIGRLEIPARTQTAMMTYMHKGRQYIVTAIAGPGFPGELLALRLPEE